MGVSVESFGCSRVTEPSLHDLHRLPLNKLDLDENGLTHPARFPNALPLMLTAIVPVDEFPRVLDPFAGADDRLGSERDNARPLAMLYNETVRACETGKSISLHSSEIGAIENRHAMNQRALLSQRWRIVDVDSEVREQPNRIGGRAPACHRLTIID